MLYKLLHHSPLAAPESMAFLAMIVPALALLDIRFPAFQTPENTMYLQKNDTKDTLVIDATELSPDMDRYKAELKKTRKFLWKL